MKRIWFISFGMFLAAVLAGCSGQVDSAAPAATAEGDAALYCRSSASIHSPSAATAPHRSVSSAPGTSSFLNVRKKRAYGRGCLYRMHRTTLSYSAAVAAPRVSTGRESRSHSTLSAMISVSVFSARHSQP